MNTYEKFCHIDTLIFDVDGVWTNGELHITEAGELLRTMNAKDGFAGNKAMRSGYKLIFITGGISVGVEDRLTKLGASEVHIGIRDKSKLFDELVSQGKIDPKKSLYMGDDVPDIGPMKKVLLSTCPNDAVIDVLEVSDYISPYKGGQGCVRDVIERVLRSQDKW